MSLASESSLDPVAELLSGYFEWKPRPHITLVLANNRQVAIEPSESVSLMSEQGLLECKPEGGSVSQYVVLRHVAMVLVETPVVDGQ